MTTQPVDKHHMPQWLGSKAARRFHVMAKPAGSACNLECSYCFYLSKQTLPGGPGPGHMDDELLELLVRQYIDGVTGDEVVFSWQGGEPTLCGLDFFRKVIALQKKYARPGQRIENDLQTNGTLLDEEWARFLKEHRFLVGLSIDGPKALHDRYRVTKRGAPTFETVFSAAKMLRRFRVPFNTLTCVNRFNASRPLDVYRFLRREVGVLQARHHVGDINLVGGDDLQDQELQETFADRVELLILSHNRRSYLVLTRYQDLKRSQAFFLRHR